MAQVSFTSFYNGPLAVYPSSTGLVDSLTGAPQLGGDFLQGNYCDLTAADAKVWNQQYGSNFYPGRYRIVALSKNATAANVVKGKPCAIAQGTSVAEVVIATAGSGQTPGNYTAAASSGAATIAYTINSSGALSSVTVTNPGSAYAPGAAPTFTIAAGGTPGTVAVHMNVSENVVTSWDSSAISLTNDPRGVFLGSVTAAQITAGAWIIIQELGIAEVLVTTAAAPAVGQQLTVTASGGTVVAAAPAFAASVLGKAIDLPAAASFTRCELALPVRQG